jgi:hypothetical protein
MVERMTYAQAVGEKPLDSPAFVAGVDFDPYDEGEVEVVKLASERHRAETLEKLREENADLRAEVYRLRGYDGDGEEY